MTAHPSQPDFGILAGMGPRSTAPFLEFVIDECRIQYGAVHDEDFPAMIIYSLPTPFYPDRPIDHEEMSERIARGLKQLQNTGIAFAAMPCNVAHQYFPALENQLNIPLINMVECAVGAVPPDAERAAIIAARHTVASGIYQEALHRSGCGVYWSEDCQAIVDELLGSIKSNATMAESRKLWDRLMHRIQRENVETAILACTDLNVVSDPPHTGVTLIDATRRLAATLVRHYLDYRRASDHPS